MLFGKCCCDIVCCCVDGVLQPERMPRKECKSRGGKVVLCPCDECVCDPTLSIGGHELTLNGGVQAAMTLCYGDAATPVFWNGVWLDKVRTFGYWEINTAGCGPQNGFEVSAVTNMRLEYDTGAAAGDAVGLDFFGPVSSSVTVGHRYFWRNAPTNEICYTDEPYTERQLFLEETEFGTDLAYWAAQNQGCFDTLYAEPVVELNCALPPPEDPDPHCE